MKEDENKSKSISIYFQAVIAMLFINFIHKLVREIPGSQTLTGMHSNMGLVVGIVTTVILVISIILLLFGRKEGLILGIVPAIWAMFQWVIVHVIFAYPDQNGVWWYPIFPTIQGILIIYFSIIAWRNEKAKN